MITDGGHNAPADPRQGAAALHDVPLYIVPIGASKSCLATPSSTMFTPPRRFQKRHRRH